MESVLINRENEIIADKSVWIDKLSLILGKIEKLQELLNHKETKHLVDKSELYEMSQLYKMLSKMVDLNQHCTNYNEPVKVDRLLKIKRYIPNKVFDYYGSERIVYGGLFTTLPIWILPADLVDEAKRNRLGAILEPEKFGLPSFEEVKYSTIKELGNSHYIALAKGTWFDDWIFTSRHIEYVYMDL